MSNDRQERTGLTDEELIELMGHSNALMDAAMEIVAPDQQRLTLSQLAMAALACKAAGQRLEETVMKLGEKALDESDDDD